MDELPKPTLGRQFTIKRLLWTVIIASAFLKLADLTGIFQFAFGSWESASNSQRILVVVSTIFMTVVGIGYVAWLGLRLPWLLESYLDIRKRRKLRREEYAKMIGTNKETD